MQNLIKLFSGEKWISEFLVTEIFIIDGRLIVTSEFDLPNSKMQEIADQLCAYGHECEVRQSLIYQLEKCTSYKEAFAIMNDHPELKGEWSARHENSFGDGGRTFKGLSMVGAMIQANDHETNQWGWIITPDGKNFTRGDGRTPELENQLIELRDKYALCFHITKSQKPWSEMMANYFTRTKQTTP